MRLDGARSVEGACADSAGACADSAGASLPPAGPGACARSMWAIEAPGWLPE